MAKSIATKEVKSKILIILISLLTSIGIYVAVSRPIIVNTRVWRTSIMTTDI